MNYQTKFRIHQVLRRLAPTFLAHRDSRMVRILWGKPGFLFSGGNDPAGMVRIWFYPFCRYFRGY